MVHTCPSHHHAMIRRETQYGPLYVCPVSGCDMLKWGDDKNVAVADSETRLARRLAHAVFDRLWLDGHMSRTEAYERLADHMKRMVSGTHIGLFDVEECAMVQEFAAAEQKRILLERYQ